MFFTHIFATLTAIAVVYSSTFTWVQLMLTCALADTLHGIVSQLHLASYKNTTRELLHTYL